MSLRNSTNGEPRHPYSIEELKDAANLMRGYDLVALHAAGSGHAGGTLSIMDITAALYLRVANHDPENPTWQDRDRIIWSTGHKAPSLYLGMAFAGFCPVEDVVLRSQEILLDATLNVEPDEKIGLFRGLGLIPAALKARKNPDEGTLQSRVPADLYARWLVQKKRYLGYDSGVENWRPIFAADKLRKATISDLNLRESGMVWEVVEKLAKDHKITTTRPQLKFTFKADDLKATIKEFSRQPLADTECFATTLALTEALSDRDTEGIRAHAWATADLETLDALPPLPNPGLPCAMAVMSSQVAKDLVPADIREQLHATWFAAVKKSLETNQTTFAIVPLAKLTRAGGYLARLRELGYVIEAPK